MHCQSGLCLLRAAWQGWAGEGELGAFSYLPCGMAARNEAGATASRGAPGTAFCAARDDRPSK